MLQDHTLCYVLHVNCHTIWNKYAQVNFSKHKIEKFTRGLIEGSLFIPNCTRKKITYNNAKSRWQFGVLHMNFLWKLEMQVYRTVSCKKNFLIEHGIKYSYIIFKSHMKSVYFTAVSSPLNLEFSTQLCYQILF